MQGTQQHGCMQQNLDVILSDPSILLIKYCHAIVSPPLNHMSVDYFWSCKGLGPYKSLTFSKRDSNYCPCHVDFGVGFSNKCILNSCQLKNRTEVVLHLTMSCPVSMHKFPAWETLQAELHVQLHELSKTMENNGKVRRLAIKDGHLPEKQQTVEMQHTNNEEFFFLLQVLQSHGKSLVSLQTVKFQTW